MDKTKVLHLNSTFSIKDLPTADQQVDSIFIEGYASTNDIDRAGDVVSPAVWQKGMENYLKNPIILAQHDYDDPVGRMVEHKIDSTGLWIKARISAAAEIFSLVKDGVLTAFSIGFRVLDAEYNSAADVFLIKEVELLEISVVSVPCNQNTLFSLSKSFTNDEEYMEFKKQFAPKGDVAKRQETLPVANGNSTQKGWNMDPKELEALLAKTAEDAAKKSAEAIIAAQAAEKAAAEKAAAEKTAFDAAVTAAVKSQIEVGTSGTERLLADVTKKLESDSAEAKKQIEALMSEVKAKTDELSKLQTSKMEFVSGTKGAADGYGDRETAVMLAKIMGKGLSETKFFQDVAQKTGAHVASATWELEVSLNMENEIRRRLVVAPNLRSIAMKTNVMTIPVNPEAGMATWITNAQFGTTASPGAAQTHQLKEITLNAYKVSTMEYLAYEEEEDALLVLLPVIRDAMVRRVARAVDKAYLLGAGAGADPVKGLAIYNVGTQATLITGQVGSIGNTPVLVSDAFPTKAGGAASAATNIGAICVAPANFLAGNQRGLRFDTQELVETQRKVMVASLRTGMTQLSTVNGVGVSALRWS